MHPCNSLLVLYYSTYPLTDSIQTLHLDEIISATTDKLDDSTDVPNNTPDMEDNAGTEVDVEHKYILEVNDDTLDNINVRSFKGCSFKDSNTVQARVVDRTIDGEGIVKLFVTELFIAFGLEFSL